MQTALIMDFYSHMTSNPMQNQLDSVNRKRLWFILIMFYNQVFFRLKVSLNVVNMYSQAILRLRYSIGDVSHEFEVRITIRIENLMLPEKTLSNPRSLEAPSVVSIYSRWHCSPRAFFRFFFLIWLNIKILANDDLHLIITNLCDLDQKKV